MTNFDEVRLPTNIDFGVTGGAGWSTDIVELFSGFEQRNQNWSSTRYQYSLSYSIKTKTQIDEIVSFFRARRGRRTGFRFRDWSDFYVYGQVLGTGDGSNVTFQFIKTYTSGAVTDVRTITKIVANGNQVYTVPKIYLNGVLQVSGYSINYNTGVLVFVSAPGNAVVVSADFEFDVPVRFDIDKLPVRQEYNKEFYIDSIPLIEVKI